MTRAEQRQTNGRPAMHEQADERCTSDAGEMHEQTDEEADERQTSNG